MIRDFITPDETARLRETCEDILHQSYRAGEPGPGEDDRVMRHLNDPRYFKEHPERLPGLLEIGADPRVLGPGYLDGLSVEARDVYAAFVDKCRSSW